MLREGWAEQLAAIELPDGEGGTPPGHCRRCDRRPRAEPAAQPPGPAEVEAALPGPGRRERRVARRLGDRRAATSRRPAHPAPGPARHPARIDLHPPRGHLRRGQGVRRHPRRGGGTDQPASSSGDDVVRVLADPDCTAPSTSGPGAGSVVPATSGDRRYTTTELLAAEQRIIDSAMARIGEGTARSPQPWSTRSSDATLIWTANRPTGCRQLLTSGNGYDLVIGQAGTGKSTMLGAARIGWEEAGYRVIGTAVAARTAADLEAGTGIPSSSLTQLLADLREAGGLTSRHVIVVDEASMVGSRPLDQLRRHVDASGAKLVLVGDNRQLSSIDAGGALRTLSQELGAHVVTLTTNRRQAGADQQWERDALARSGAATWSRPSTPTSTTAG